MPGSYSEIQVQLFKSMRKKNDGITWLTDVWNRHIYYNFICVSIMILLLCLLMYIEYFDYKIFILMCVLLLCLLKFNTLYIYNILQVDT